MYRPESWELGNIRYEAINAYLKNPDVPPVQQGGIYEKWLINAGADAMLEALKKEGQPTDRCNGMISEEILNQRGYLVFIPEEGV